MKSKKKVIGISVGCVCALAVVALAVVLLVSRCGKEDKGVVKASPKTYVVKYESHGGAAVKDGKYTPGEKFILPIPASGSDPKMYGYSFTSWSYDADGKDTATVPLDEDKAVNGVITLHAGWTNIHTVYFDTRTEAVVEPRQYKFGESVPVADLPKAPDRVVGGITVPYANWVNASSGQAITEDLRMEGTDMYLYAAYDTGVTSRFELLDDGTYSPLRNGATTWHDTQLKDGQVFYIDMLLPADPAEYTGGDAGPVFAATGFNQTTSTFDGNYYIWMTVTRSDAVEQNKGGISFWGYAQGDSPSASRKRLAYYKLTGSALKGTPYAKKMSAYLNGGKKDKETRLTFSFRKAGSVWCVGIDGIDYFTLEPGQPVTPKPAKPDEGGTLDMNTGYEGGSMVGFRTDVLGTKVRFADCSVKNAGSIRQNPANRHTVTFDTKTSQKIEPRTYYPGDLVTLPPCSDRTVKGVTYKFLYWADQSTSRPLRGDFRMPTYDMNIIAQYDIGTSAQFELLDDGTYKPTVTNAKTAYGNLQLLDGNLYTVEMVLPANPMDFETEAGPVFAATGFNSDKSTFNGYYMWMTVIRANPKGTVEQNRGGIRFMGYAQNGKAVEGLAYYKLSGAVLKNTKYAKKMTAYLNNGVSDRETRLTFTFRREGNVWYIGVEGEELFVMEAGKAITPKPVKPDEYGTKAVNSGYQNGKLVGFQTNSKGVRFANPTITSVDNSAYRRTLSFDTKTDEKIDPLTFRLGTTVKASDLPKPKGKLKVQNKEYEFQCWADESNHKQVPAEFKVTQDMKLYAHYRTGVTPAYELQSDGTFSPTSKGAQTNYVDKLSVGKVWSVDMILPENPADFKGGDAGPIFAANGFTEADSTFAGYDRIWVTILRSDTNETNKGGIRIITYADGKVSPANFYAYYKRTGALSGSAYASKMTAYLKGGADLDGRTFTFDIEQSAAGKWIISIDDEPLITLETGKTPLPAPKSPQDEGCKTALDSRYANASLVGFQTDVTSVRFANPRVESKQVSVYFKANTACDTAAKKYSVGEKISASDLPTPEPLMVGTASCPFKEWKNSDTKEAFKDVEVTADTGDMHLYAVYDISKLEDTGVIDSRYELREDGFYAPLKLDGVKTWHSTCFDWKLVSGKTYAVDMVLPDDPESFKVDAGPVFGATGFSETKADFGGNYCIWVSVVRTVTGTTATNKGAIRVYGSAEGTAGNDTAMKVIAYYKLTGSALKDTEYAKKMNAYMAGEMKGGEMRLSFAVSREGNSWHVGIDGEELFTLTAGKEADPKPVNPPDEPNGGLKLNSKCANGELVGIRTDDSGVLFANPSLKDTAAAAAGEGLFGIPFADSSLAKRFIFLPVDPSDVTKESFSPVRLATKQSPSKVRTEIIPAKALLARIKAIFRAGL